jgi:RNA polymerase sigma factor (sigma-70 family)
LRQFAQTRANEPFAELVRRHIDFVYGAALRQVGGDAHLAGDVTQLVFSDLARKSAAVVSHPVLAGWLHTSTRFAATQLVRAERRRRKRELEAQAMHDANREEATGEDWAGINPLLDELLGRLKPRERDALLLRFFECLGFAEIGTRLSVSESGARSCVDRALDKLQRNLARRGITSTAAALGTVLTHAAAPAPAGLASSVASAAIAGTTAGGFGAVGFVFVMSKIKTALVSAIIIGGIATTAVQVQAMLALRSQLRARPTLREEIEQARAEGKQLGDALRQASGASPEAAELVQLRARLDQLRARPDGVLESEIRPPRNLGRATPAAAIETYSWALGRRELDLVASFVGFSDDTPENRREFMAQFSEEVRLRYPTPERLVAAGLLAGTPPKPHSSDDGMQVFQVSPNWRPGVMDVRVWLRQSGREFESGARYVETPNGWAEQGYSLTSPNFIRILKSRLEVAPQAAATAGDAGDARR